MLGRQVVPRGNEHTAAQSPSSTGSGPLRDSRPALADTVFSLSVVTESFRKTYKGRVQKRGQTGLRIVMAIHRDGKRLGGAVAAVLSLALSAVLMVPGWVWADCCCLKGNQQPRPNCRINRPVVRSRKLLRLRRRSNRSGRTNAVAMLVLPIGKRRCRFGRSFPTCPVPLLMHSNRNASGSAVCERQLATWAQGNPPPGTDRVLLCRWLA
ncbi:MAG: hypothetical protein CM1200mP2_43320 [Planctomycetaceae bacterium]|nr:MAG: hypothetical protein CM1200mP2_43320 [Planctomycetaceae bacterium]